MCVWGGGGGVIQTDVKTTQTQTKHPRRRLRDPAALSLTHKAAGRLEVWRRRRVLVLLLRPGHAAVAAAGLRHVHPDQRGPRPRHLPRPGGLQLRQPGQLVQGGGQPPGGPVQGDLGHCLAAPRAALGDGGVVTLHTHVVLHEVGALLVPDAARAVRGALVVVGAPRGDLAARADDVTVLDRRAPWRVEVGLHDGVADLLVGVAGRPPHLVMITMIMKV